MLSGHRSAWRRRGRNSRAARIAAPLAIPMALGLTLGIIIAVSGGNATRIDQSALGSCAGSAGSAAPSGSADPSGSVQPSGNADPAGSAAPDGSAAPSASAGVTAPCPTASDPASPTASPSADPAAPAVVPPAATFANGPVAFRQLGDLATDPVDGTGAAINLNQTPAEAATSMNCTLTVPNHPLTARGLATPYQLGDGCSEANTGTEGAFVEATILAPNGSVQVYNPLVVTAGTTAAAAPVPPKIARGSQVIIDIGSNGNNLVLEGRGARQGNCVDALGQSVIGQVSACNAVNFYRAANAEIAFGLLRVPPIGTSEDREPCETVRNFALIDQDQSDNVLTTYLLNANGQTAQDTAANAASLAGATPIANGSDDRLLANFVDPANDCSAFSATNTTDAAGTSGAQALNELSARVNQTGTIAVVPVNDEMTLVNSAFSVAKTNVYRSLVDQPLLARNVNTEAVAADYCQNMVNMAPAHNQLDMTRDAAFASPVPATGNNLATFLGARLAASFGVLNCQNFGLTDPANVTTDGAGIATAVTYNLAQQTATIPDPAGGTATPTASPTAPPGRWSGLWSGWWRGAPPRRHGHHQNGTGM